MSENNFYIIGIWDENVRSFRIDDSNFKEKNLFAHERFFGSRGIRWRFRKNKHKIYWYQNVDDDIKIDVSHHLSKKYSIITNLLNHVLATPGGRMWMEAHGA